jgi:E3 ubiquitin-protein ligase RNF14
MKRGGRRLAKHNGPSHNNENWRLKSPHDQNQDADLNLKPITSDSEFTSKSQNPPQNIRFVYHRGRRPYAAKPQFEKKSDSDSRAEGKKSEVGEVRADLNIGVAESSSSSFGKNTEVEVEISCEEVGADLNVGVAELNLSSYGTEGNLITEEVDDVALRLEELRLNSKEEDLSEDVLRINDQLQEDELLAMESIFGENIIILDRQPGLRSFEIHIHIEDPNEFTISTTLMLNDSKTKTEETANDFSYSFKVKYLPPLILTCLLPKSYPTHRPPHFTISTQWLSVPKLSDLCSMLDSIWNEQKGQEVIYQWVECLQGSSLSYLGLEREIVLGPYDSGCTGGDRRAISGSVSPDADIPFMRTYNDEQLHLHFRKDLHECCICFSEFPGTDFVRLPCQHFYCYKCIKTYSDIHVKEGTVSKLLCPDSKCQGMIPPGLLRSLFSDEDFERWESMLLAKTLESMADVAYCPRCETACIEDEDNHAQCTKCFFNFCTLCREKLHVGVSCMTPEMKLRILEERQNSGILKEGQRKREREMIDDMRSLKEVLRDAKQCPSCKIAISKTEGCNKMECNNCGSYFCYRCSRAIIGYDHFREGACELFPQAMIRDWEERINERQVVGQIQADMFFEHGHPCPICAQINVKIENNNDIFCWSCQTRYCYLCKTTLKRRVKHFGPKGCKQHTAG